MSHSQHFLSVVDLAHSVLAATTDACFVLSVEGVVELVNNAAEHMFMKKAHKIMGQHIAELLSGPGLSSFLLFSFCRVLSPRIKFPASTALCVLPPPPADALAMRSTLEGIHRNKKAKERQSVEANAVRGGERKRFFPFLAPVD